MGEKWMKKGDGRKWKHFSLIELLITIAIITTQ